MRWFFCYSLEEVWLDVLHICAKSITKVLAFFNYNERETVVYRRIFILYPKSPPLPSENKLVFRFSNQQKHVVLCWQNHGKNPKLFHLFYFILTFVSFALLLPLLELILSEFPQRSQSRSAKLTEDEQQPPTVHLWAKKTLKFLLKDFIFNFKNNCSITNPDMCDSDDSCCKAQNATCYPI